MPQESQTNQYENQEDFQKIDTRKLNEELHSLEGSVIIELFEIDTAKYGGQIYRFHAGKMILGDIVFGSKTYSAYPLRILLMERFGSSLRKISATRKCLLSRALMVRQRIFWNLSLF